MAWLLQPHDYRQVLIPNFYRVDYGRVGAYKGMGRLGQAPYTYCSDASCSNIGPTLSTAPTLIDPVSGLTVVNPASTVPGGPYSAGLPFTPNVYSSPSNLGTWMQANSGMLAIGAVLLVIMAAGRR